MLVDALKKANEGTVDNSGSGRAMDDESDEEYVGGPGTYALDWSLIRGDYVFTLHLEIFVYSFCIFLDFLTKMEAVLI
ncbi:hypothetical protein L1987_15452 [Smallanthus sonchifolius]|uniref:Uncharacterized protein n=1 Tax=Smallanthus sonchifolius TaxID=185202 RepID=A0ACB9J7R4_9ASTR|nr:hypothetical protein L1987_15452 [Smallanthus sonchifolius]